MKKPKTVKTVPPVITGLSLSDEEKVALAKILISPLWIKVTAILSANRLASSSASNDGSAAIDSQRHNQNVGFAQFHMELKAISSVPKAFNPIQARYSTPVSGMDSPSPHHDPS